MLLSLFYFSISNILAIDKEIYNKPEYNSCNSVLQVYQHACHMVSDYL